MFDVAIIGAGVAGLSAGIYAGRYRMKVGIFSQDFGGETARAGIISNYPGLPDSDGYNLISSMKKQALGFGAHIQEEKVVRIIQEGHCFQIITNTHTYDANTIIFAQGSLRRHLNLPLEQKFTNKGVHYCVTCDGPVYTNKTIAIVGGGDASVKGVILAAEYAKKIYFILRDKEANAEPINSERMNSLSEKVEIVPENEIKELVGRNTLEKIILVKAHNGSFELSLDGLFVEIGSEPDVDLALPLGVTLDTHGYIQVDAMMRTNIDGIFAAGDAVNHFGRFKQCITAAAMGAVAATSAYEDDKIHGELCHTHSLPPKFVQKEPEVYSP